MNSLPNIEPKVVFPAPLNPISAIFFLFIFFGFFLSKLFKNNNISLSCVLLYWSILFLIKSILLSVFSENKSSFNVIFKAYATFFNTDIVGFPIPASNLAK